MPGRGKTSFGKYVSKNFQRLGLGTVKAIVNTETNEVAEVTIEVKAIDEIPKEVEEVEEDDGASVDALIVKRKESARHRKPVNKQKNTN
jgi:hypothetical protein